MSCFVCAAISTAMLNAHARGGIRDLGLTLRRSEPPAGRSPRGAQDYRRGCERPNMIPITATVASPSFTLGQLKRLLTEKRPPLPSARSE